MCINALISIFVWRRMLRYMQRCAQLILKFLSPHQSTDFNQGSAVSPRLQPGRNIGSASVHVCTE